MAGFHEVPPFMVQVCFYKNMNQQKNLRVLCDVHVTIYLGTLDQYSIVAHYFCEMKLSKLDGVKRCVRGRIAAAEASLILLQLRYVCLKKLLNALLIRRCCYRSTSHIETQLRPLCANNSKGTRTTVDVVQFDFQGFTWSSHMKTSITFFSKPFPKINLDFKMIRKFKVLLDRPIKATTSKTYALAK